MRTTRVAVDDERELPVEQHLDARAARPLVRGVGRVAARERSERLRARRRRRVQGLPTSGTPSPRTRLLAGRPSTASGRQVAEVGQALLELQRRGACSARGSSGSTGFGASRCVAIRKTSSSRSRYEVCSASKTLSIPSPWVPWLRYVAYGTPPTCVAAARRQHAGPPPDQVLHPPEAPDPVQDPVLEDLVHLALSSRHVFAPRRGRRAGERLPLRPLRSPGYMPIAW